MYVYILELPDKTKRFKAEDWPDAYKKMEDFVDKYDPYEKYDIEFITRYDDHKFKYTLVEREQ